jgi:hypothetical protein
MARFERERCDADLCIGQLARFVQHAMRASGVACHPAHTTRFPTHRVRVARIAAMRLANIIA